MLIVNRSQPFAILAATALLLLALPASALTLADASWPEMLRWADCVVAARVESLRSEPSTEPGAHGVRTRMRLKDVHILAGNPGAELDVLLPGGELNGRRVSIPGAPRFAAGEAVILFLRHCDDSGNKVYCICGYGLGVLRQRGDRIVPDIPVDGGPPASGESLKVFDARFGLAAPNIAETRFPNTRGERSWLVYAGLAATFVVLVYLALRRRWRRAAIVAALTLAMLGSCPGGAGADAPFTYQFIGARWDLYHPLPGRVASAHVLWNYGKGTKLLSDAIAFDTIRAAFQKWEGVANSTVAFRQASTTTDAGSGDDERNIISFMTHPPTPLFDTKTLAVTFNVTNNLNVFFTDTDIVFNDRDIPWVATGERYSLDVVALHEIGHSIGLSHSENKEDVMYPVAQGLHELSISDAAGAAALYPLNADLPNAVATASPTLGAAPLAVAFSSALSNPGAGATLSVQWDFGDGSPPTTELDPQHTYAAAGTYTATLTLPGLNAAPVKLLIQAFAASTPARVVKFDYTAAFISKRDNDKLALTFSGAPIAIGDQVRVDLAGAPINPAVFSSDLIQPGSKTFSTTGSAFGGTVALKFDQRKSQLALKLSGAHLGRQFDFREAGSASPSGTFMLPLSVVVTHGDGSQTLFTAILKVQYQVKRGGTLERSIQGKLAR
jgi:hypothetical protein